MRTYIRYYIYRTFYVFIKCIYTSLGRYTYMGVSKNSGTTKSSILIGFSIINHPFWDTPIFGTPHIKFFAYHSVVLDAIFPLSAPRAPRSLMHMPKERLLGHSWSPRGFSTTGAKSCTRLTTVEHLRLKKRLVISSEKALQWSMIPDYIAVAFVPWFETDVWRSLPLGLFRSAAGSSLTDKIKVQDMPVQDPPRLQDYP